jgi:UTP:GlnB (protein PII) uridylyltransferase
MESEDAHEASHEIMVKSGDIIQRLSVCACDLEKLLGDEFLGLMLFGSWARGEARNYSDVDVLIVLRSVHPYTMFWLNALRGLWIRVRG